MSDETVWGIHSDNPKVDFIASSEISIGWHELGDPRTVGNDREALKALLAEKYPEAKSAAIPSWAGMLIRFIYEMQPGDLVVYSGKADESFNIGRVAGEYEYRDSGDGNPSVRKVEWLKLGEPRAAFSGAARTPMRSSLTLFKLPATADEFRVFLETGAHTGAGDDGPGDAAGAQTDSESDAAAVSSLIPAEHADEILEVLAASIRYIHSVAPNAWCITLRDDGETVRLNLRNAQAWALRSGGVISLEVVDDAIASELFPELQAENLLTKWTKNVTDESSSVTVGPKQCGEYWPGLRDAHFRYLDQLAPADPTGGTPFWKSHRPALVDALSDLIGEQLPQPTYVDQSVAFVGGRVPQMHGLLTKISTDAPIALDDLLADARASELFQADNDHVSKSLALALIRLSRELGLVEAGSQLQLTELGARYVAAINPNELWHVTEAQKQLLRSVIQERAISASGAGICGGAVLALSLWRTVDQPGLVSLRDFGRALAVVGNGTTWRKPSTFSVQGGAYTNLLKDVGLLSEKRAVTPEGADLLNSVDLAPHASFADALSSAGAASKGSGESQPTVWWVNQGGTYQDSVDEGLLWAPKVDKKGQEQGHWTSLTKAQVGDLVIQYSNGEVRAVATVTRTAEDCPKPEFAGSGEAWAPDGWGVAVQSQELAVSLPLTEIPAALRTADAGPFTAVGSVKQGYFFPVSPECVNGLAARFPQLGFVAGAVASSATPVAHKPAFDEIVRAIQAGGLRLSEQTIRRYHLSIETRGFVILAGLSGSGKTQLAKQYSDALGAKTLLVPVAPNWTANEDLLGYVNPMDGEYVDTEFSRFLSEASTEFQSASAEGREPLDYHLILDEMNLARVEYYFAKFLSAMELTSGPELPSIELGGEHVQLTPNLKFIGTVNVDETTHGFADKVYDRAQLIEIPVDRDQIAEHLGDRPYRNMLLELYDALLDVAPFAYRVLDNIGNYVDAATESGVSWQDATDEQILQKILPKVKGTDPRTGVALLAVIELTNEGFPLSNAKARQMSDAFRDHGFVSFF